MTIRIRPALANVDAQNLAALLTPVLLSQPRDGAIDGTDTARPGTAWIRWSVATRRPTATVTLD